ncbi:MAG: sigma-70 family RNA polymerase sigma factor [Acidaminococcus sp.]|jgi:RNA polymerase sigma factor (sigma-70 family)|nr:sigma-70 family RNA polymerase sigma factor [Acidaminococcus sp.]MCI2101006.1 sigma-70 family RNA polymerase sigma factor [Acidaminococcus sp.]MCI2117688.1 sigma-70 family RNA polymerase sigma factor [Acidaminococcus sp.]
MRKVDFAKLLPLAQANQQDAQVTIIQAFQPLINSFLRKEYDYGKKEDMRSYLTLAAIEAMKDYKGTDIRTFPGYVKDRIVKFAGQYQGAEKQHREIKEKIALEPTETTYFMETAFDREDYKALHNAMKHLYPYERKLLISYYGKNKSMDEIAHEYHISKSKVSYQLKKLRRDLRTMLTNGL